MTFSTSTFSYSHERTIGSRLMMLRRLITCVLMLTLLTACTRMDTASAPASAVSASTSVNMPERARNVSTIPHTLRIGDNLDITSLNPYLATALSLGFLSSMTMAYLVRYGADSRPIPELATTVPSQRNHLISRDGRTITWHLRKGVRWSDGAPLRCR